jgi:hypothetical protein
MTLVNGILSHLDLTVSAVWIIFRSRATTLIPEVYRYPPLRKLYVGWSDVSRMTYWATWTGLALHLNPSRDLALPPSPVALVLPHPHGHPLGLALEAQSEQYQTIGTSPPVARPHTSP